MFASQLCLLTYLVSSVLGLYDLKSSNPPRRSRPAGLIAFVLFWLASFAGVAGMYTLAKTQASPLSVWSHGLALLVASLTLMGHYLLKMRDLTAFVAPFLIVFLAGGLYAEEVAALFAGSHYFERQKFVAFHLAAAILGQGFALGACIVAALYLWQRRALKARLLNQLATRIPALDQMENILVACLWTGFLCLSTALVSGWLVLFPFNSGLLWWNYFEKLVWAISVWMWYCLALVGRILVRLSGKRLAQMSVGGFVLLSFAFFGFLFWSRGVFGE